VLKQVIQLIIVTVCIAACCSLQAGDVAIVVHKDVPVDDMSFNDVRKLFMGERQYWTSKMRVTLLVRAPTSRERDVVLQKLYQMTESQFRQYWISRVFRAETASGPKLVYSADMAVELAAAIPGAVAFVDVAGCPASLKVLKIDGRLPGDKGYPLR
jgi:hypothetical protein